MSSDFSLRLKVLAVNKTHAEANKLMPLLLAHFAPFVGQKIELVSGGLTKKAKQGLPELVNRHDMVEYIQCSTYSLILNLRGSASAKNPEAPDWHSDSIQSCESALYIANTRGGVIESLHEWKPLRTDYTWTEIAGYRADYQAKKQAADDARKKLYHFGEFEVNN